MKSCTQAARAYQRFDKTTFLQHIDQERRRELFIAYRNHPK